MTGKADKSPQLLELQSLRGFAAMTVMIHHSLRTIRPDGWAWTLSEVPLNARGAVVLFFVLSGYVLGLSLMRRGLTRDGLLTFYVRRAFRIYPALWVAMALGAVYIVLVRPIPAPNMADWAQRHFNPDQLGVANVLTSLFGITNYVLPTAWTITVELGASAVLPLIVFVLRRHLAGALALLVALLAAGLVAGFAGRQIPFYIGAFGIGAALACLPVARRIRPTPPLTLMAVTVMLFSQVLMSGSNLAWLAMVVEAFAAALLIAGIIAHGVPWMRARPLVAIGDWSYSIYLLHLPIAYTVMRLLDRTGLISNDLNLWSLAVALITTAIVVPLAATVYRFVEVPGIAMGSVLLRMIWPQTR